MYLQCDTTSDSFFFYYKKVLPLIYYWKFIITCHKIQESDIKLIS